MSQLSRWPRSPWRGDPNAKRIMDALRAAAEGAAQGTPQVEEIALIREYVEAVRASNPDEDRCNAAWEKLVKVCESGVVQDTQYMEDEIEKILKLISNSKVAEAGLQHDIPGFPDALRCILRSHLVGAPAQPGTEEKR